MVGPEGKLRTADVAGLDAADERYSRVATAVSAEESNQAGADEDDAVCTPKSLAECPSRIGWLLIFLKRRDGGNSSSGKVYCGRRQGALFESASTGNNSSGSTSLRPTDHDNAGVLFGQLTARMQCSTPSMHCEHVFGKICNSRQLQMRKTKLQDKCSS